MTRPRFIVSQGFRENLGKFLVVLTRLVNTFGFRDESLKIFAQVQAYFQNHRQHVAYADFELSQLPLGSGMVESDCKWLIQQRFKGVGMRLL